jgi:hypothetical protein
VANSNKIDVGAGTTGGDQVLGNLIPLWKYNYSNPGGNITTKVTVSPDGTGKVTVKNNNPTASPPTVVPPAPASPPGFIPPGFTPPLTVDGNNWVAPKLNPRQQSQVVAEFVAKINAVPGATGNWLAIFPLSIAKIVGSSGTLFVAVENLTGALATSPDGLVWTSYSSFPASHNYDSLVYGGGVWCLTSTDGSVNSYTFTSSDGHSWVQHSRGFNNVISGISWNGSVFCGHHSSGNAYTSTDAVAWTAQQPGDFSRLTASGGTKFIGNTSYSSHSTFASIDGTGAWTENATLHSDHFWKLASNGTLVVALAYGANIVEVSTNNGATWVAYSTPATSYNTWQQVVWNGHVFCATPSSGNIVLISSDGYNWTLSTLPSNKHWSVVSVLSDGTICLVAASDKLTVISKDNGVTWVSTTPGIPGVSVSQTDINNFNAKYSEQGIAAGFSTYTDIPVGLQIPTPVNGGTAPVSSLVMHSAASFTVYHDGMGRYYDFKLNLWTNALTDSCKFYLTQFPYTLNGIADVAVDRSPYGVIISQTFMLDGETRMIIWAKSDRANPSVQVFVNNLPFDFGHGNTWQALQWFYRDGWDNSFSIQHSKPTLDDFGGIETKNYFTWDAAGLSVNFANPGFTYPDSIKWWVYLDATGKLQAISTRTIQTLNIPTYGKYNFYDHLISELPRMISENVVLFQIAPTSMILNKYPWSGYGMSGVDNDYDYKGYTWSPDYTAKYQLFYSVIDFPADSLHSWQATKPLEVGGYFINNKFIPPPVPLPPGTVENMPTGPLTVPPKDESAPAHPLKFLVGGSFFMATQAPLKIACGGSLSELTAPPLPFNSGGSLTEHVSSFSLPIPDQALGGLIQHTGLPFVIGG